MEIGGGLLRGPAGQREEQRAEHGAADLDPAARGGPAVADHAREGTLVQEGRGGQRVPAGRGLTRAQQAGDGAGPQHVVEQALGLGGVVAGPPRDQLVADAERTGHGPAQATTRDLLADEALLAVGAAEDLVVADQVDEGADAEVTDQRGLEVAGVTELQPVAGGLLDALPGDGAGPHALALRVIEGEDVVEADPQRELLAVGIGEAGVGEQLLGAGLAEREHLAAVDVAQGVYVGEQLVEVGGAHGRADRHVAAGEQRGDEAVDELGEPLAHVTRLAMGWSRAAARGRRAPAAGCRRRGRSPTGRSARGAG